jgi:hypothetical protein
MKYIFHLKWLLMSEQNKYDYILSRAIHNETQIGSPAKPKKTEAGTKSWIRIF